jgi:hypothetical protein
MISLFFKIVMNFVVGVFVDLLCEFKLESKVDQTNIKDNRGNKRNEGKICFRVLLLGWLDLPLGLRCPGLPYLVGHPIH